MSPEESRLVDEVSQLLRDEKNKYFLIELPSEIALALSMWLKTFETVDTVDWNWDSQEPFDERFFPMIRKRLTLAIISSQRETIVPIELNYREISILGHRLYQFKADDPEIFLVLNEAFVLAGGRDNEMLRRTFELSGQRWE